jgi:hypothetical protein
MSNKPILFHDIDGVLFGEYDGEFQFRPGVKTWLKWAHENFEVVWLTSWEADKVKDLLHVLYCDEFLPIKCAAWMNYANKETWLQQAVPKLQGRDWFWIDDLIEEDLESIKACGLPVERCIQVSAKGVGALRELRDWLETLSYQCKGAE